MQHFSKKLVAPILTLLVVATVSGVAVPSKAYAQFGGIFHDPINYVVNGLTAHSSTGINLKEYVLDPLAYSVVQVARQTIIKSTVNWINSGFQGSPGFVTNLQQNLLVVGDTVASDFLRELGASGNLDSPFRDIVAQGLRNEYYRTTGGQGFFDTNAYTLNNYSQNPTAFQNGDFTQGGLSAWFASQRQENNVFASYLAARNELRARVSSAVDAERTQLSWSGGFRSFKKGCNATAADAAQTNAQAAADAGVTLSGTDPCLNATIVTPGSLIKSQLDKVLGSNVDQFVQADELDEIVNALVGQMINRILGSGGLLSASQPSAGGGRPFIDQTATPTTSGGTSMTSALRTTLTNQRAEVAEFQQNWQKIQTAANAAQSCSSDPSVQSTITRGGQMLAKATTALSSIDGLLSDITVFEQVPAANQPNSYIDLTEKADRLLSAASSPLPTVSEIAESEIESQDISGTLYNQMRTLCGGSQ